MQSTEWRPFPGFEEKYLISNTGQVASLTTHMKVTPEPRIVPQSTKWSGHMIVSLVYHGQRYTKNVHRAVLEAFGRPPGEGEVCRHRNGNPADNRIENLEWGTASENMQDMVRHGTSSQKRKTHCPAGHPYDAENTRVNKDGRRACITCSTEHARARNVSKRNWRQRALIAEDLVRRIRAANAATIWSPVLSEILSDADAEATK